MRENLCRNRERLNRDRRDRHPQHSIINRKLMLHRSRNRQDTGRRRGRGMGAISRIPPVPGPGVRDKRVLASLLMLILGKFEKNTNLSLAN